MLKRVLAILVMTIGLSSVYGASVTVTVPQEAVQEAVRLCELLRVQMRIPADDWNNDVCATELFRRGLRNFAKKVRKAELIATAKAEMETVADDFNALFPGATRAVCGDGILQDEWEECDDGNAVGADGCSARCTTEP